MGAAACRKALWEDPDLGGMLERLGLLPEGTGQAHHLTNAMEWAASLPRIDAFFLQNGKSATGNLLPIMVRNGTKTRACRISYRYYWFDVKMMPALDPNRA